MPLFAAIERLRAVIISGELQRQKTLKQAIKYRAPHFREQLPTRWKRRLAYLDTALNTDARDQSMDAPEIATNHIRKAMRERLPYSKALAEYINEYAQQRAIDLEHITHAAAMLRYESADSAMKIINVTPSNDVRLLIRRGHQVKVMDVSWKKQYPVGGDMPGLGTTILRQEHVETRGSLSGIPNVEYLDSIVRRSPHPVAVITQGGPHYYTPAADEQTLDKVALHQIRTLWAQALSDYRQGLL